MIRWVAMLSFPADKREEAEDWYLNVHAPEVCAQPGLKKYFSYRALQSPYSELLGRQLDKYTFVTELWYEDWEAFKASVIDRPIEYTPPSFSDTSIGGYDLFETVFIADTIDFDFMEDHLRGQSAK